MIIVDLFFYAFIAVLIFQFGRLIWKKVAKALNEAHEKHLRGD